MLERGGFQQKLHVDEKIEMICCFIAASITIRRQNKMKRLSLKPLANRLGLLGALDVTVVLMKG